MSNQDKIEVENINCPGRTSNVDAIKYKAMKKALLIVLSKKTPGLTQKEMMEAVVPHLPEELWPNGEKSGWWVKTVQLDLEAKQKVLRTSTKPIQWYRFRFNKTILRVAC